MLKQLERARLIEGVAPLALAEKDRFRLLVCGDKVDVSLGLFSGIGSPPTTE